MSPQPHVESFVELLRHRAASQPNDLAFVFVRDGTTEAARLTYGDVDHLARRIAAHLQGRHGAGERALLLYPPGLEFVTAFLGCMYAGILAVPVYPPRPRQSMAQLESVTADSEATMALTTSSLEQTMREDISRHPRFRGLDWIATDGELEVREAWSAPPLDPDSLAFLQYTSGSTSQPKGVIVRHGNLLHNQRAIQEAFGHTDETVVVGWLPTFHDMGLIGNVLQPLYLGRPCILMAPADFIQRPVRWLEAISKYRATTSGAPCFAYALCARKVTAEQKASLDLSSWRLAFNGAEPVRAEVLDDFSSAFAVCGFRRESFYPCYGLAESTLFVSGGGHGEMPVLQAIESDPLEGGQFVPARSGDMAARTPRILVGCGHPRQGQTIAIVDPETRVRCPEGSIGEIWIRGPSVAKGYWKRPKLTAETFEARLADTGEGPFLRTGDLGIVHANELFITGRCKDVIIIRGRNHYPQHIEATVQGSHAALRPDCGAAVSIAIEGEERLVILQEVERTQIQKLDVDDVTACIREAVAAQHGLRAHAIVLLKTGAIPKTSSGKIRRHACIAGYSSESLERIERAQERSR